MKAIRFALGVLAAALGGLWFLQGLGIVHVRPILCFADCAPLQGPSQTWAIIGFFMIVAGALAIFYSLKPRS